MTFDVQSLEPKIRAILTAPGVDLTTISAKRVRKQLMEENSALTADVVKDNKEEIDGLISQVFQEVNTDQQESEDDGGSQSNKRKKGGDDEEGDGDEDDEEEEAPKKKKAKKGQEKSDAKLARKLSNEINGRATRAGKSRSNGTSKKGGRTKKSATTVDSDDEGDDAEGGKKKKRGGGGGKGGFGKEYGLRYVYAD